MVHQSKLRFMALLLVFWSVCSIGPAVSPVSAASHWLIRPGGGAAPAAQPAAPVDLVAEENGGRVISATDETNANPAINLIDGCAADYCEWRTHSPAEFPQVIVFGLAEDEVKTIDEVVLNPWTSDRRSAWVKDFQIYVSDESSELDEMERVGEFTLDDVGIDQSFSFDPVQAKYIALVVTSNYGSADGISLDEFEVYAAETAPADPADLAAAENGGRIVSYSSEDPNGQWPASQLIDGDGSTGWSSENLGSQSVVFALAGDRPHTIDRVVLNPYSDNYREDWIKDFELRISATTADPQRMTSLGEFELAQAAGDQEFTFAPAPARYVALLPITNYGGSAFELNEFSVYAAPAAESAQMGQSTHAAQPTTAAASLTSTPESTPETTTQPGNLNSHLMNSSPSASVDTIQVEPTYVDSVIPVLYHLYGDYLDDLVSVEITNHSPAKVKLRVESDIPDLTESAIDTVELGPGESAKVAQDPPLLPAAADQMNEARAASLHVKVEEVAESQSRLVFETTAPLTVYARGDFPWNLPGFYNGTIFLATMVTPNDPSLDPVVRAAADYHPRHAIDYGYGEPDDGDHAVFDRMAAIYQAVSESYQVTYVHTGKTSVSPQDAQRGMTLQRLKLPYEVLDTHSGMCVETSLLFAALFEKIGLDPIIITHPGHAYVAVPISKGSSTYYVLETTMVGSGSFEQAIQYGSNEFHQDLDDIAAEQNDDYFWLDVSKAREEGLVPIPWR